MSIRARTLSRSNFSQDDFKMEIAEAQKIHIFLEQLPAILMSQDLNRIIGILHIYIICNIQHKTIYI